MGLIATLVTATLVASQANAKTWMDAFDEILILEEQETEQIGDINASFGQNLQIRIILEDENYQSLFRNSLKTEIISSTIDKTNDPTIKQYTNVLDQSHLQKFEVNIPVEFDKEGKLIGKRLCNSFIIRTTFLGSRVGYDVTGEYVKERKVMVCKEVKQTPTPTPIILPSPTIIPSPVPSQTPSPTPTIEASAKPSATPNIPTTISLNTNDNYNTTGSGAIAACSKTILGKGIKTVVMAIPVAGMIPIAFSLISMTSAVFTSDRRRPEHWVKVVDAVTGKPVGGAIINIVSPDGKVRATWKSDAKTGNAGDLLQPGQYEFIIQRSGYIFPSVEEPMFPMQSGEFVYRSGLVNFNHSNMNVHG
jgi:hypothetical protein